MEHLECVKVCPTRIEAEIAKGVLESNDIKSIIVADDAGGMQPPLQNSMGVELRVHPSNLKKAKKILER